MTSYIILISIISIVLAVFFFFRYIIKRGKKTLLEQDLKLKNAKKAKAKITGISYAGIRGTDSYGEYQTYRVKLEVYNDHLPGYNATTYWRISNMAIPKIQQGLEVKVKIDTNDKSIIYPNIEGVEYCLLGASRKEH